MGRGCCRTFRRRAQPLILGAFSAGGAIEKANQVFQPDERFRAVTNAKRSSRRGHLKTARLLIEQIHNATCGPELGGPRTPIAALRVDERLASTTLGMSPSWDERKKVKQMMTLLSLETILT